MVTTGVIPVSAVPRVQEPPLLGSLGGFQDDRIGLLERIVANHGDVAVFHFGPFPTILFNRPEFAQSVLVDQAESFDKGLIFRTALRPFLGQGLFISEDPLHRRQRKIMAPSFQPRHLAVYADTMGAFTERAQAGWPEGQVVDIAHEMTTLTMSIIGKVLFDSDVFSEADTLGAAIGQAVRGGDYALTHLVRLPLAVPTPRNRRTTTALALVRRHLQGLIDERRASTADRDDFLSRLLAARDEDGQGMSDKQVSDEALTLFVAGHETTATALAWAFYLLAQHPEIYARLQAEVDTVLAGRTPTVADLPRLPYALQIFKETLRLYPPAYLVSRGARKASVVAGYEVPRTWGVIISIYTMHRHPEFHPDPLRFDPERFTPENEKRLPRYAYLPFGAGQRVCIGNHLATMEGQLILAALAQRVTFELVPGQTIVPQPVITLKQREGARMVVRRRDGA
ncbi:MAG TPA: cytochrome P450 [Chloroflexia bacterium]|nr:cytochrome P450 [Chloroflexia bacterium]